MLENERDQCISEFKFVILTISGPIVDKESVLSIFTQLVKMLPGFIKFSEYIILGNENSLNHDMMT